MIFSTNADSSSSRLTISRSGMLQKWKKLALDLLIFCTIGQESPVVCETSFEFSDLQGLRV